MPTQRPRLFVVDDDRAVLSLSGTGVSCLDMLRALRSVLPQCEAVLTAGYPTVEAALDAAKQGQPNGPASPSAVLETSPGVPAPLIDVQREHIVRTLRLAQGNKAVAARLLGISRRAFYRQLERHGLHQRVPLSRRADALAVRSESSR